MARVLVTGGAGFIGSRVVRALEEAGHAVRVLDRLAPTGGSDAVLGDVRDPDAVRTALRGVDVVDHHAATVGMGLDLSDLPRYAAHNDLGTAVLLAGMHQAGVGALVLASSMVVYGEGSYRCAEHGPVAPGPRREKDLSAGLFEPPCALCGRPLEPALVAEDALMDPRSGYAVTKLTQEHLAGVWARESGGRAALLRYHNVYGPGLPRDTPYAGVAAIFLSSLRRGEAPVVFEDGAQRRDFVHVDDVAAANVAAVGRVLEQPGLRAYNVASGTVRTVLDLARGLARVTGGPEPVVSGRYRAGDVRHITAGTARIRAELGWRPRVEFADGLAELVEEPVTTG